MYVKNTIITVAALFLLVGCGDGSGSSLKTETKIPSNFSYKVVNNRGLVVESKLDNYTIKIYSDSNEEANPKNIHKGVVVKVNGESSETMPIEISYLNKNIIVVIYDELGNELAVSAEIEVTDVPVVVVELTI